MDPTPIHWAPLWLSLKVAGWSTIICAFVGTALGWFQARARYPGRELIDALLMLPMVLPPTVLGYYLLVLLGRRSPLGHWLHAQWGVQLIFTWQGAVVAAAVVALPLVYKAARLGFEAVPTDLENAGRALGLTPSAVFARITLPLAWKSIAAGCLLAFARAMGEFGATLMVAGNIPSQTQTLALAVYDAVQSGNDNLATTLVLLTSAACVAVLLAAGYLLRATPRPSA